MPTDLTILHCEDASLFVKQVVAYLKIRGVRVDAVCLNTLKFPLRPSQIQSLTKSKGIIVFISPHLLDFSLLMPNETLGVGYLLKEPTTIAVLCGGITEADILDRHKKCLNSYDKWQKLYLGKADDVVESRIYPQFSEERKKSNESSISKHAQSFCTLIQNMFELECGLHGLLGSQENEEINTTDEIMVIPTKATKEQNCLYLILRKNLGDLDNITVSFNGADVTKCVAIEKINPYAACFRIPEENFDEHKTMKIEIWLDKRCLWRQDFECVATKTDSMLPNKSAKQDDQLNITRDAVRLRKPPVADLCTKYGLQELGVDCGVKRTSSEVNEGFYLTSIKYEDEEQENKESNAERPVVLLRQKSGDSSKDGRNLRRTFSFPSLFSRGSESNSGRDFWEDADDEIYYVDMSGRHSSENRETKPHEEFLHDVQSFQPTSSTKQCYKSFPSNDYVSMKYLKITPSEGYLQDVQSFQPTTMTRSDGYQSFISNQYESINSVEAPALDNVASENKEEPDENKLLTRSQLELVELLQAFKRGVKTISEVEHLFEDWHSRHRGSLREELKLVKDAPPKLQRGQSFGILDLIFPRRKESKEKGPASTSSQELQPVKERDLKSLSKISNSSSSSGCSGISDRSGTVESNDKTTDSSVHSDGPEVPTKKISTGSTSSGTQPSNDNTLTVNVVCSDGHEQKPPTPPVRPPPKAGNAKYIPPKKEPKVPKLQKPKVLPRKKLRPVSPDYVDPNAVGSEYAALDLAQPLEWKKNPTFLQPPDVFVKKWISAPTCVQTRRKISSPTPSISYSFATNQNNKQLITGNPSEDNLLKKHNLRRSVSHSQIAAYMELVEDPITTN